MTAHTDRPIPVLQAARLTLRPFTVGDTETMHSIMTGRDVLRYFPPSTPPTVERIRSMIERLLEHWTQHGYGLWAIEQSRNHRLMGRCGFQYLPDTGEVEIDFILGRAYWGHGYATEAAREAMRFGFGHIEVDSIVGIVHPDHIASQRVLEKVGMASRSRTEYFGMDCFRYVVDRAGWMRHIEQRTSHDD